MYAQSVVDSIFVFFFLFFFVCMFFFFQAEDGIRYLVRSRGLGDVYKRQVYGSVSISVTGAYSSISSPDILVDGSGAFMGINGTDATCLLYTSDAADERSSVDLGGCRILKKKKTRIKKKKKVL